MVCVARRVSHERRRGRSEKGVPTTSKRSGDHRNLGDGGKFIWKGYKLLNQGGRGGGWGSGGHMLFHMEMISARY